ncbi:MAG: DUF411 domain-containing protein [Brevundimonas sp.]|uniref:DUF411 domain-containing protein n=1 Tax=Brevundimonas sp. TaxID=1871086 RepID=UPI002AB8AE27|nr:DUF411 domain-containing protein [Brevundimonas sp.]
MTGKDLGARRSAMQLLTPVTAAAIHSQRPGRPVLSPATLNRRLLLGAAVLIGSSGSACARSRQPRDLVVYKTPTCPCCDGWIAHMRQAGFTATVNVLPDLAPLRSRHGLPDTLASCHTGLIDGYLVEGHVPAADVLRLLAQRPRAVGLAVPGMPLGSPGMETPQGRQDAYDTLLVLRSGATRVFARHNQTA